MARPWLHRIDDKIAGRQQREAETERGWQRRPAGPERVVEPGIGNGAPPTKVHAGGCYAFGKRHRPADSSEARGPLTTGLRAAASPASPLPTSAATPSRRAWSTFACQLWESLSARS
ncbi:DUF6233 domain-containing protein [Streptomyces sp. NPDC005423]|uniref:DUF6233 domain-containing protein n=1 Tax=Streptomyces sp. NPDC005423 TaxID=3155343 RepID=UPI0033A98A91